MSSQPCFVHLPPDGGTDIEQWRCPVGLRHRDAHKHIYVIVHMSHADDVAWGGGRYGWTQAGAHGRVMHFTFDEALAFEDNNAMPDDGRWHAVGYRIPLSDGKEI